MQYSQFQNIMRQGRADVLKTVQGVREGAIAHRHLPWARHAFRIPERDFYALRRLYPGLSSTDPAELTAAWEEFERSPFSEAYRIGRLFRGVIQNGLIEAR